MKKNTSTRNKKGFSLIELCIVLGVMAIFTSAVTPVFIKRVQIRAGEKTALEMSVIQQAALAYYAANNAWPGSIQALQSAGYLNPAWVANNPWQNAYLVSSGSGSFTVSTSLPQEWTSLVARDLPGASVSGSVVVSTMPVPGSVESDSLFVGAIIFWSGTVASIPNGWQLCDGSNGTPDLRDRFVVGARQDYGGTAMTGVSGSLTKTGGEAYHTLTIDEMPAHSHTYNAPIFPSRYDGHSSPLCTSTATSNTSTVGGGRPHNNLGPYYALCFIMRIR
jgi:prepilin-type N-terminal cleavage/methylation domain-containing protein